MPRPERLDMWSIYERDGKFHHFVLSQVEAQAEILTMGQAYAVTRGIDPELVRVRWARGNSNYYMVARPDSEQCSYWPSAFGKLTKAEFDALQAQRKVGNEIDDAKI